MPLYSYSCPKCGRQIELIRPSSERDELPLCVQLGCDGQQEMHRQSSASSVALVFKGDGWTLRGG